MSALATLLASCGTSSSVDAGGVCAPACRDGFTCLAGECVSACNPPCGAGERCTGAGMCVDDAVDGGGADAGERADGGATDAGAHDAGADDAAAADAGAPGACPDEQVRCGGACVAPTLPDVGVRLPTTGDYGVDWFESGDVAIDPCTGTIGLAYAEQLGGSENWEVYFVTVPATLGSPSSTPIRITTAPGPADSVAIAWAGDRFLVFWSDPRHDPMPEACSRCLSELYVAGFDASGAMRVPETRLTTYPSDHRVASTRAVYGPATGEVGLAWVSTAGTRQVFGGIVAPDGTLRDAQVVSTATAPQYGSSPRVVWNDDAWVFLYRHDDPDGARPDYLHTRKLGPSGLLSPDLDLRVPAEQIALTARGTLGYATVTTGGSPLALRLWDLGWTATTTLAIDASTFDGTRGLAWDGADLFVTSTGLTFEILRLNGLGTETGAIPLTMDSGERAAGDVVMHRLGTRLVLHWVYATRVAGSTVHHRIQVVDTSSAM